MDNQPSLDSLELAQLKKRVAELEERQIHMRVNYEHLKQLYEKAPLAYQSLDTGGCLIEVNRTWLETLGYTGEKVVGRNIDDFLHPDSRESFRKIFSNAGTATEPPGIEIDMIRKNGSLIRVLLHSNRSRDPEDQSQPIHCIFHDITKPKESKAAQRESYERFKALHTASFVGMVIHDRGSILECNLGLSKLCGYTPEELIGMDMFMLVAPEYRNLVIDNIQRNYSQTYEIVGLRKDGTRYPVRVRGTNIPYKGRVVRLSEIREITEYQQMEEAFDRRLFTRTPPLTGPGGITFEDLFDLAVMQRFQDEFAAATGVASIITSPDGTPITAPSNFTRLCSDIIRTTTLGRANCFTSDAAIGGCRPKGPIVQRCLSGGLWDAGARITIGGQHIANWLIGQVRIEPREEEDLRAYARIIGADEADFIEAFNEVPLMSRKRFEHISQALYTLANQLSSSAYQNIQHARFITERKQTEHRCQQLRTRLKQAEKQAATAHLACRLGTELRDMFTAILDQVDRALLLMKPDDPYHQRLSAIRDTVERSTGLIRQLLTCCPQPDSATADDDQPQTQ
jgi:PAS domain S-box-containing protein